MVIQKLTATASRGLLDDAVPSGSGPTPLPPAAPEGAVLTEDVLIGERLRAIRRFRHYTLKDVANRAGLSESFLSQVERNRANPSVASLKRIADAIGVTILDLFDSDSGREVRVLRREDRATLAFGILGRKMLLTQRSTHNVEVIVGEFDPGGSAGDELYSHGDSEEIFVVLSGTVQCQVGPQIVDMRPGDSILYRSSTPHTARNTGNTVAEVMWIISPPSY